MTRATGVSGNRHRISPYIDVHGTDELTRPLLECHNKLICPLVFSRQVGRIACRRWGACDIQSFAQ